MIEITETPIILTLARRIMAKRPVAHTGGMRCHSAFPFSYPIVISPGSVIIKMVVLKLELDKNPKYLSRPPGMFCNTGNKVLRIMVLQMSSRKCIPYQQINFFIFCLLPTMPPTLIFSVSSIIPTPPYKNWNWVQSRPVNRKPSKFIDQTSASVISVWRWLENLSSQHTIATCQWNRNDGYKL